MNILGLISQLIGIKTLKLTGISRERDERFHILTPSATSQTLTSPLATPKSNMAMIGSKD